jgi:hypothetical protein
MAPKKNPLKLNKLQLRTLVLSQVLARDPNTAKRDATTGDVTLFQLPHAHGDHAHIGRFTVPLRDLSGFTNPAVWTALVRKGLARECDPHVVILTAAGAEYETGLGSRFPAD